MGVNGVSKARERTAREWNRSGSFKEKRDFMILPLGLERGIEQVESFLRRFYPPLAEIPDTRAHLLAPTTALGLGGEVLVLEDEECCQVGIRFGQDLYESLESNPAPQASGSKAERKKQNCDLHTLGIIAEEVSHFQRIVEAAEHSTNVSLLDLEVLGEIDRFLFLFFLHLNDAPFGAKPSVTALDKIAQKIFCQRSFDQNSPNLSLYIKAEAIALKHIRRAFECEWQLTSYEGTLLSNTPGNPENYQQYFRNLRESVVTRGASVRIYD